MNFSYLHILKKSITELPPYMKKKIPILVNLQAKKSKTTVKKITQIFASRYTNVKKV